MKMIKRKPIDIEFTEQKADPKMMKLLLTLDDWMYKKMRKILLWLTLLKITKANWWGNFPKKLAKWLFDNFGIVPNEKKN